MHLPHDTAVVVLSGGQDSTTCLFQARELHTHIHAITFDYGQRHAIELNSARLIAAFAGVDSHEVLHLPMHTLHSASPLVSDNHLEQYADADHLPGGIEKTFIPMRNQLFLTLAANRAVEQNARWIYTGVCETDFGGYPDCRREFVDQLQSAINDSLQGTKHVIAIQTPLMYMTKADSVRMALGIRDCWEALAYSHTAYDGVYPPTGHDHASLLRARGFEEAGIPDPLVLRAVFEKQMEPPKTDNYSDKAVEHFLPRLERAMESFNTLKEEMHLV